MDYRNWPGSLEASHKPRGTVRYADTLLEHTGSETRSTQRTHLSEEYPPLLPNDRDRASFRNVGKLQTALP
jgi:hypothetical protein